MEVRRLLRTGTLGMMLLAAAWAARPAPADEKPSALKAAAAEAERIVIAAPQQTPTGKDGAIDVAPGERFTIEVQNELRGTGNKSVLIINGGDEKQHPRYVNGKPYVFLLKRNAGGKGWLNIGAAEIPVKKGKVQWLSGGKVTEEIPVAEFEEFVAARVEPVAEKTATRDTLTGNWLVVSSDKGSDVYLWLMELTPGEGGGPAARLVASTRRLTASRLKSAEISGNDLQLVFSADGVTFDFQGRFSDGLVRGTVVISNGPVIIARMEPTELTSLPRKYDDPVADPNHAEFVQAISQENPTGALTRFVRRHPSSPLAIPTFQSLVSHAAGDQRPRDYVEKLGQEFCALAAKWGPRMELQALVDLGAALSVKDHLPDLALEYLTAAHQKFADDTPGEVKRTVEIERGRRLIGAGREAEGVAVLDRIRNENPFDPIVLYSLARQAEKDQRLDDALELYGRLQVLPLLEQSLIEAFKGSGQKLPLDQYPRRVAAKLWIDKHGDGKALPEWLDNLYATGVRSLVKEVRPARSAGEGNRVVLCELFTTAGAASCIAADVAVTSLEATCGPSEVVVLRYHLHETAGDPLANAESQERFKMYSGQGTPMVVISGRPQMEMGGGLVQAPLLYRRLYGAADSLLKDETDLKIELSAQANQGKIAISAKAVGLSEFPQSMRLMIALTEDRIEMQAKNGIRVHEHVVRAMTTGAGGAAVVKGALAHSSDVDLAKLKKSLARQIADKEAEAEGSFDAKPLDLAALHVVAFLQNSESGEVYQAVSIPVKSSE